MSKKYLLWMDLESTGLSTSEDAIIEVAAVLTDTDLNELGQYESLVQLDAAGWERLMANDFVRNMHESNGLLAALRDPATAASLPEVADVEQTLLALVETTGDPESSVLLAGSGVSHFDHELLKTRMPALASRLGYATIDVGVMRRAYLMWTGGNLVSANDDKTHRSMDDIQCHLAEARAFRELFLASQRELAS
ncbi:MAG: exonuclease domain-containing protein [Nakamurella sp.]